MWIFYVNYPNSKRAKINILIIEERKRSRIDEWGAGSIKHYIMWLFRAGWILRENFIGFRKESGRIILHLRGSNADIKYILEAITRSSLDFEIKQRSLTMHNLGYFKNAPSYWMRIRGYGSCKAYDKALYKTIPRRIEMKKEKKSTVNANTKGISGRNMTVASLNRRFNWLMGDLARVVYEKESFIREVTQGLSREEERKKMASFLRGMSSLVSSRAMNHLFRRVTEYVPSLANILEEEGLKKAAPAPRWIDMPENITSLKAFALAFRKEITLYENELRRSYDRYEETGEPIFFLNGCGIDLKSLPNIQKKLSNTPPTTFSEWHLITEENEAEMKEQIEDAMEFLKDLPGARVPELPETIRAWLTGEEV